VILCFQSLQYLTIHNLSVDRSSSLIFCCLFMNFPSSKRRPTTSTHQSIMSTTSLFFAPFPQKAWHTSRCIKKALKRGKNVCPGRRRRCNFSVLAHRKTNMDETRVLNQDSWFNMDEPRVLNQDSWFIHCSCSVALSTATVLGVTSTSCLFPR
jgi:hypothetical protein